MVLPIMVTVVKLSFGEKLFGIAGDMSTTELIGTGLPDGVVPAATVSYCFNCNSHITGRVEAK